MILYALHCADGHRFESWFADSGSFDVQARRGLVTCPRCDSPHVVKAIMAPAVVAGRGAIAIRDDRASEPPAPAEAAPLDDPIRRTLHELRTKILAETRDVGPAFAEEARRIHAADSGERIRGQATLVEARDLLEDGVMVLPLPSVPEDRN